MDHQYLANLARQRVTITGCGPGASGTMDYNVPIPKWARFAYIIGRGSGGGGGAGASGASLTSRGGGGGAGRSEAPARLFIPLTMFNGLIGVRIGGYGIGGIPGGAGATSGQNSYLFIPRAFVGGFPPGAAHIAVVVPGPGGNPGTTTGGNAGFSASGSASAFMATFGGNQSAQGGGNAGGTGAAGGNVVNLDFMNSCGGAGGGGCSALDADFVGGNINVRSQMMLSNVAGGAVGGGNGGSGIWNDALLFGTGGAGGGSNATGTGGAGGDGTWGCGGGGGGGGITGGAGGNGGQGRFDIWWIS